MFTAPLHVRAMRTGPFFLGRPLFFRCNDHNIVIQFLILPDLFFRQRSKVLLTQPSGEERHAPGKLRTNVQLPNFDEFHKEFDVKEGDGMWRAPEDRVIIW